MSDDDARNDSSSLGPGLAGIGAVALVVGCCAALPLIVALAGSVALGAVLGAGAGIAVLATVVGLLVLRARRRAVCEALEPPSAASGSSPDPGARPYRLRR